MAEPKIAVLGIKELRKALGQMDKGLAKEVSKALKAGAAVAADKARGNAPKRTGKLAASIRPGASGAKAYVKSSLIYAGVHEYGGRVGINKSVRIAPKKFINRGVDESLPEVMDTIGDELDALAKRNGF